MFLQLIYLRTGPLAGFCELENQPSVSIKGGACLTNWAEWPAFNACLEDRLTANSAKRDRTPIDKFIQELTSASYEFSPVSAPECCLRGNPRPSSRWNTPEEPAKEAVVSQQQPQSVSPGYPPPEIRYTLTAERMEKWPVERYGRVFRHGETFATKNDKEGDTSVDSLIRLVYTRRPNSLTLWEIRGPS